MTFDALLPLLVVFISVGIACAGCASLVVSRFAPEKQRLREVIRARSRRPQAADVQLAEQELHPAVERIARTVRKSPANVSALRRRLTAAGYRSSRAFTIFTVAEIALPLVLAAVALAVFGASGVLLAVALAGLGFMVPRFMLGRRMRRRQRAIQNGLPDALDLLTICLEAGCTLDQAVVRASGQLALAHAALAEELSLVRAEMHAGKFKSDALRHFAERTQVDDVRSLVGMLLQSERFGTSIAQTLKTHAESLRSKRRLRAEERASKAGVKLVFPLVFCFFPAFYVVILGPSIIQFVRVFFDELPLFR